MSVLHVWLVYSCSSWDDFGSLVGVHMTQAGAMGGAKDHARRMFKSELDLPLYGLEYVTMFCRGVSTCRYEIRKENLHP